MSERGAALSTLLPLALAWTLFGAVAAFGAAPSSYPSETPLTLQHEIEGQWLRVHAKEAQDRYRLRVNLPSAGSPTVSTEAHNEAPIFSTTAAAASRVHGSSLWLGLFFAAALVVVIAQLAPNAAHAVYTRLNPWSLLATSELGISREDLAERKAFDEFLVAFRAGPRPGAKSSESETASAQTSTGDGKTPQPAPVFDPLKNFLTHSRKSLAVARDLLKQLENVADQAACPKLLGSLATELGTLKSLCSLQELLPVWQMASSLESLLKQLLAQPARATTSALRSVTTGIEVIDELSRSGLKADVFANPPPRFLAVDDDAISRHAVSLALKKAFSQPDVATDGKAALALASQVAYDAIFLDVLMPGMDGFELCSHIHETTLNRTTPVVFVTMQTDFDTFAKSTLCGGTDLLGKPFLTFEITVKAIALTLRRRLQAAKPPAAGEQPEASEPAPPSQPQQHQHRRRRRRHHRAEPQSRAPQS